MTAIGAQIASPLRVSGMRVLMLVPHPQVPSPIATIAAQLVGGLRDRGLVVSTFPFGRRSTNESTLRKAAERPLDILRAWIAVRHEDSELLYVHTSLTWHALLSVIPLLTAVRLARRSTLVELHGGNYQMLSRASFRTAARMLLELADGVAVLSEQHRRQLLQVRPSASVSLVLNPYDPPDAITSVDEYPQVLKRLFPKMPLVLFAGRLIREKGARDLIEAFALIVRQVDCSLVIAGDGPERSWLCARVADLDLADRVFLAGHVTHGQLVVLYSRATVLVLPTYHPEGMPMVLLEAMAYGVPLVTSAVGAIPELLKDGANALIVPPRSPNQIASATLRLLTERDLRDGMRRANLRRSRDFRLDSVIATYISMLERVTSKRSPQ